MVRNGEENWVNGVHNIWYLAKVLGSVTDIFQTRVLEVPYQNLCKAIETNSLVHEAALLATFSREKENKMRKSGCQYRPNQAASE